MYTTYRWSDTIIHTLTIERVDTHNFRTTIASGSGRGINSRIEFTGLEAGTRGLITKTHTVERGYDSTRRIYRNWCCRARLLGLLEKGFTGDTELRDLLSIRDDMPETMTKHWNEWCPSCGVFHHMAVKGCPSCGIILTKQPASERTRKACKRDYSCETCRRRR